MLYPATLVLLSFPINGAPLAYLSPTYNPLPSWFITFAERLYGRFRFKTPAQQGALLGTRPHLLTLQLYGRSGPSILEYSVVRETLGGLALTVNSGWMVLRLLTLYVPQFLGVMGCITVPTE